MAATRVARYPSGIDFSCGFQPGLPSGTRSRTRRLTGASRSTCAEKKSVIFMETSLVWDRNDGSQAPETIRTYMSGAVMIPA